MSGDLNYMELSQFRLYGSIDGVWLICTVCQARLDGEGSGLEDLPDAIQAARTHAEEVHGCDLMTQQSRRL